MFGYQQGLLGSQEQGSGLLGGQTQDLMRQYLQNLFMRRYQPPAIPQQPGMVGSRMGPGGMQYMAPQVAQAAPPGKTEMQRMQEQLAALQAQMQPSLWQGYDDFGGGW
jgi:hypothetical protein